MTTAVFGGSFDPPHVAHAMACAYALAVSDADRLLVVPCARHAFRKRLESFDHRLAMCRLGLEGVFERVEVSELESRREGVSYMVDTLDELKRARPGEELLLVVGSDVVEEIPSWRDADRLGRLASLLVVPRAGRGASGDEAAGDGLALPDINSTWIRERLGRGEMPDEALARRVAHYIRRHGLYGYPRAEADRTGPDATGSPLAPQRSEGGT